MIQILSAHVANRIAAGEVIERPASVVRELLDNSLDAQSSSIDVSWSADKIRVVDNGNGMSREDIALCWKPHATSKIRTAEDLQVITSLGFRGEALSSIAAAGELIIHSTVQNAGSHLVARDGKLITIEPAPPQKGTSVEVRNLFAHLPARRRFLSTPSGESRVIRATCLEKALPFPQVRFRLTAGSNTPIVFPTQSIIERCAAVFGSSVTQAHLHELHGSGDGFTFTIIAAEPSIHRRDRKLIHAYVNNRKVNEYKLLQAIQYAYQDVQHGGIFPISAVLLNVEPALVDFNIHPAKQEVRIRMLGEVRHRIIEVLRSFLQAYITKTVVMGKELSLSHSPHIDKVAPSTPVRASSPSTYKIQSPMYGASAAEKPHIDISSSPSQKTYTSTPIYQGSDSIHAIDKEQKSSTQDSLQYHGTLFGTFLVVEQGDTVFLIDQHAAHERILYNRFMNARTPQALLIPQKFETNEDQDKLLQKFQDTYREMGIIIEKASTNSTAAHEHNTNETTPYNGWMLTAYPPEYKDGTTDIIETLLFFEGEQISRDFYAQMACRAAAKAGDYLEETTALQLAEQTLALPEPRCPHGRPLWVELRRSELEKLIGRR